MIPTATKTTQPIISMFVKDYATVIRRPLPVNLFMEESFVKVGTNLKYSAMVCDFVDQIPEIGQQQYEEFVDSRLIKYFCKMFLIQLRGTIF